MLSLGPIDGPGNAALVAGDIPDTEIELGPATRSGIPPRYAPAYAVARDRPTAPGRDSPAEAGRLEFLVPDEGQRSSIADLVAMGADPAGAWPRLISMIEANPDLVLTSPALERACAIAGASRNESSNRPSARLDGRVRPR